MWEYRKKKNGKHYPTSIHGSLSFHEEEYKVRNYFIIINIMSLLIYFLSRVCNYDD